MNDTWIQFFDVFYRMLYNDNLPVEIPVIVFCHLKPFPFFEVIDEHRLLNVCHPLHLSGHGAFKTACKIKRLRTYLYKYSLICVLHNSGSCLRFVYLQISARKQPVISLCCSDRLRQQAAESSPDRCRGWAAIIRSEMQSHPSVVAQFYSQTAF